CASGPTTIFGMLVTGLDFW
nr:immunoglobulin heavy chain junction region [Macaca mulatta]MOX62503.1 immunoglobulin heavy chain junction region [Macaca mulatta]MOX65792.1 immunoglobulin heavy chain junction region [Macaca mulatta]MOX66017.1 immunoglobulin heavy chain junction region [Macaca mulatta]